MIDDELTVLSEAESIDTLAPTKPVQAPTPELLRPNQFVCIGASAGGLEALTDFFSSLSSNTGAAYIVVQHLSPDFKSVMDELLAKHTDMPVMNVVDGVTVRANSIYLITPRKNMLLADGNLYLSDQVRDQGLNLPIDVFLRSMAEDVQQKAVAIILSGTGSDGSRGIKAIKESGGLVMVQDPQSAKFDGMPYNAMRTGHADFVLTPSGIAEKLDNYLSHPLISDAGTSLSSKLGSADDVLKSIFNVLRKECRIDFSEYKASTVARRIERRMGINQVVELPDYLRLLEVSQQEVQTLARELLINVTRFFRDEESFEYLEENIIAPLVKGAKVGSEIRVWVAGCSTGEEAYSLAIQFDEVVRKTGSSCRIKIFATDVDAEAIAEASAARYRADIVSDVTPERIARYFSKQGDEFELLPSIRKMVVFAKHNVISDPPFSNIDLITCRNVMIYFQHSIQKKVITSFHFSLKNKASIFFGASESLGDLHSHFTPVSDRLKIYRKVSNTRIPLATTARVPQHHRNMGLPPVSNILRTYRSHTQEHRFDHVKDRLINDFVPACIMLNAEHQAVHVYGDANKYLSPFPVGRVSTNVHDIIDEQLSVALDTALTRAKVESKPVYYTDIPATFDGAAAVVNLHVEYFAGNAGQEACFAVVISDADRKVEVNRSASTFNVTEQTQQRIRDLENELLHKQEHLQVTNEELETTNEELQAANEELMSSNEEMQSTNEELQSVNEELFTVNSEYQEKINELSIANDDLDNVLSATSVGMIFLDPVMQIRKFTNVAARFFHLLSSDLGRPLHHISNELEYPSLFDDITSMTKDNQPRQREVFANNGSLVQLRLLPYRVSSDTDTNGPLGTIITVMDLSPRLESDRKNAKSDANVHFMVDAMNVGSLNGRDLALLIVDDSDTDRMAINRLLQKIDTLSIRVFEASSIESALELLDEKHVDVCIVDYQLGPKTAKDFSASLRDAGHNIPQLLMSGHGRDALADLEDNDILDVARYINKDEVSPLLLELSIRQSLGVHVTI